MPLFYSRPQRHIQRGFTLVELVVVVAISAILMGIAVPDFIKATRGIELSHQAKEMESAIKFTRAKAMQLGQEVVMCRSNSTGLCATGSAPRGWALGWIVFSDVNSNGVYNVPTTLPATMADEQLFQVKQSLPTQVSIVTANASQIGNYIAFNAAGEASGNLGNLGNVGTFRFSHTSFTNTRSDLYLIINRTGRVRILNDDQCMVANSGCLE